MVRTKNRVLNGVLLGIAILMVHIIGLKAHAIQFANGQHRIFRDEVQGDIFFGGYNLDIGSSPSILMGHTKLEFLFGTQRNQITNIFGGSGATPTRDAIVSGDTFITVYDSDVGGIYGGGGTLPYGNQPTLDSIVRGAANIKIFNSNVQSLYGGGGGLGTGQSRTSVGAVNILIDNSTVRHLRGSSRTHGTSYATYYTVQGDVNITVMNGSEINSCMGAHGAQGPQTGSIGGSFILDVTDSRIDDLSFVGDGSIEGKCTIALRGDTSVGTVRYSLGNGNVFGKVSLLVEGNSIVDRIDFLPTGPNRQGEVLLKGGRIKEFNVTNIAGAQGGSYKNFLFDIEGGTVENLHAGVVGGKIDEFTINLKEPGSIDKLSIGHPTVIQVGNFEHININVFGGIIQKIEFEYNDVLDTIMTMHHGTRSSICEITPGLFKEVSILPGAEVRLGRAGEEIKLRTLNMNFGGTIIIPAKTKITLDVHNLVANGGRFDFEDKDISAQTPLITFEGIDRSSVVIETPLTVQTADFFPYYRANVKRIPLAKTNVDNFARKDLFVSRIRTSLVWADIEFDKATGTWFLTNIDMSKDYYGYLSGRKASGWLREQGVQSLNMHSARALLEQKGGVWLDVQGGDEVLELSVGSANMPWGMVSAGYDYTHKSEGGLAGAYGVAVGVVKGWDAWGHEHLTRNRIQMALVKGYGGVAYKGIYSILGMQYAVGEVASDSPGFETNKSWSEVSPTGSLELGWKYEMDRGWSVVPKGKVFVDFVPEREVVFVIGGIKETVGLKKTTNLTGVLGVSTCYEMKDPTGMDMDATIGLDWIKGITGKYEAYSRVFGIGVVEEHSHDTVRITLGGTLAVEEDIRVGMQIFGDVLGHIGFGVQGTIAYMF